MGCGQEWISAHRIRERRRHLREVGLPFLLSQAELGSCEEEAWSGGGGGGGGGGVKVVEEAAAARRTLDAAVVPGGIGDRIWGWR